MPPTAVFTKSGDPDVPDVAIIGAGVAGISAAIEARRAGLSVVVFEAAAPFSSLADIPRNRAIVLPPTPSAPAATAVAPSAPAGSAAPRAPAGLAIVAGTRDEVLADLERQRREAGIETEVSLVEWVESRKNSVAIHHAGDRVSVAQRVIVAMGRSGSFPRLGCPGADLDKVHTRHPRSDRARRDVRPCRR